VCADSRRAESSTKSIGAPFFRRFSRHDVGPALPWCWSVTRRSGHLRKVIGATDPAQAEAGLSGDLRPSKSQLDHASISAENAAREVAFFFPAR